MHVVDVLLHLSYCPKLPLPLPSPPRHAPVPSSGSRGGGEETYVSMEVCTNILHESRESVRRASAVSVLECTIYTGALLVATQHLQ